MNKHWEPEEPMDDTAMSDDDMPQKDMGDTSMDDETTSDYY